jgi:wobble nucleotide-excising tRNase
VITKFKSINNLAVFQNYEWDTNVQDAGGNVVNFKHINIIYGRNYSGKTTLARIIRALEKGEISDKYENPEFEVSFNDTADAFQTELSSHGKKVRVFNEDFVKENLRFIIYPDESITPFAILGGNATIEAEIELLKSELGDNKDDEETGFYLELKNATQVARTASQSFQTENSQLNQKLSYKATNNPNGIKYKSERFGDQNYTIRKLEGDIANIIDSQFIPLTDEEVALKDKLILESVNPDVQPITRPSIDIKTLSEKAETLITKPISSSNKIEQLVKDSILNRWVKEGRQLHKEKLDECSFCGNDITQERWNELDSHFDEESEKLEKEIDDLIIDIEGSITNIETQVQININSFYSKYHSKLNRLIDFRKHIKSKLAEELTSLKLNLQERKRDLLNPIVFNKILDSSKRLEWCWNIFENIRLSANNYSNEIGAEQSEAKKLLRLREIHDFVNTIQYENEVLKISQLKTRADLENQKKKDIDNKIAAQLKLIDDKGRLMNDEEKGALKVNEFLNNFFGHEFLTLKALEDEDQFGDKKIRFEIIRNGNKAHHLSEGECSLIAFCYFMAKLEDIETKGSKPIIWIDDPISSLDSNHIFFVYSLINSEIVSNQDFEQLFISTHNLDFLKYLKRLPAAANSVQRGYFIISRESEISKIKLMPKYLKDYVTEFNFLFHQIYLCANAEDDDESQHSLFYNFGNNTRKFLEAFLFYKYPNANNDDKLTRFFGDNNQASSMTDRINNEFSHLEGLFERSMTPIDVPEMKKTATFILDKIKEKDIDQYEALLVSIGAESN